MAKRKPITLRPSDLYPDSFVSDTEKEIAALTTELWTASELWREIQALRKRPFPEQLLCKGDKVYLLWAESSSFFKIGFTSNSIKARINQIQTGCPLYLHVVAAGIGTKADEQFLHNEFKSRRLKGEWFDFFKEPEAFRRLLGYFKVTLPSTMRIPCLEDDQMYVCV